MPGVGAVGLGPFLAAPLGRGVSRLGQVRLHAGGQHLLDDKTPPCATLHSEGHVVAPGEALRQPPLQHNSRSRADLAGAHLAGLGV
jgi:hypothetical protein